MLHSTELTLPFTDAQVEVFFYYTPGRAGRVYLSNGDPGYPEEYPEVEITKVVPVAPGSCYCDIMEALSDKTIDAIKEKLLSESWGDDE